MVRTGRPYDAPGLSARGGSAAEHGMAVPIGLDVNDHNACVNAWLARVSTAQPRDPLVSAFERAFAAMWQRAHLPLGDVTLMAIVDRVLHGASQKYPVLATLTVDTDGIQCRDFEARAVNLTTSELEAAIRYVLVEFLTVLGHLTAEVLTPALHAELSKLESDGAEEA